MAKSSNTPVHAPVVPHLTVDDATGAIAFYKKAFAAVELARHPAPDGKKLMHATVMVNGFPVMLNDDFPEYCGGKSRTPRSFGGSPVVIHLNVPDVDAAWKRAVAAGAEVVMPLADQFWGDRYGSLRDPYGHEWSMATHKNDPTPAEMDRAAKEAFAKMPAAKARKTAAAGPRKAARKKAARKR